MARPRPGAARDAPAAAEALFRRDGSPPGARFADLGCPDCRGVLTVTEEPDTGLLTFACRVGHRFSDQSLLPIKEDQLETELWSAVEVYEELADLHRELGARAERRGAHEAAASYRRRADRAQANADTLRGMIAEDEPAITEPDQAGGPGA